MTKLVVQTVQLRIILTKTKTTGTLISELWHLFHRNSCLIAVIATLFISAEELDGEKSLQIQVLLVSENLYSLGTILQHLFAGYLAVEEKFKKLFWYMSNSILMWQYRLNYLRSGYALNLNWHMMEQSGSKMLLD